MSIRVMVHIWEKIHGISSSEKLVLLALADHANDEGRCYPSMRHIAYKTDLSVDRVRSLIAGMEKKSLLTRTAQKDQYGRPKPNFYDIHLPEKEPLEAKGLSPCVQGVHPVSSQGPIHYNNKSSINPQKHKGEGEEIQGTKTSKTPHGGTPQDFNEVWPHFPEGLTKEGNIRKSGMGQARKAWNLACTSPGFLLCRPPAKDIAIAILQKYATSTEPNFIALATTFINQGRWENFPDLLQMDAPAFKKRKASMDKALALFSKAHWLKIPAHHHPETWTPVQEETSPLWAGKLEEYIKSIEDSPNCKPPSDPGWPFAYVRYLVTQYNNERYITPFGANSKHWLAYQKTLED